MKEEIKMNSNTNSSKIIQQCLAESTKFVPTKEEIDNDHPWPDPLPIKVELLRVQPFDDRLLPEPLATFVKDCAFRMQCPPNYIGAALITMLSSLIGASCAVKPKKFDDWVVIPNLWGGIIGEPSALKTPAITEAFSPLHKLEKEANKEYEENFKEWDIKNKTSKIRENLVNVEIRDQMKKDKSFTDQQAQQYYNENKPQQHPKPIRKRYKINDATIEKLHEILSENPRGVMVFRDELVGFLNLFNKQGHETDRSFYLEAWNGFLPVTVDRIQRGTVEAENTCVSIFGSAQPDKIKGYLYKSLYENDNDGFLQRFQLLVYPDPLKQWQYVDQAPAMSAQEKYCELAAQIGSGDFLNLITELQEVKGKQCFSFDDEAQDLFIIWLTEHENRLRALERADDPIVIQHLSKYRKLMPALALIFHQINIATGGIKTGKITKASTVRAICWCEYLESHARRIYGMALDIGTNAASVLTRKIEQGNLGTKFYLRDIYRKQWSFLKDSNSAEAACEELVKAHWLKEISTEPSQGQKIRTEYIVNPKIIITKKEERGHE